MRVMVMLGKSVSDCVCTGASSGSCCASVDDTTEASNSLTMLCASAYRSNQIVVSASFSLLGAASTGMAVEKTGDTHCICERDSSVATTSTTVPVVE